jgi:hypothetical protein
MKKIFLLTFVGVPLISILWIGCMVYVPPGDVVYAPGPPPAPLVEAIPAVPYPDAVWIDGYWGYYGGDWGWRGGHYERRPHPGANWHRGEWHHEEGRGWGWRPGRWR